MHSNDLVQDFVGNDVDIAIIENDNDHILTARSDWNPKGIINVAQPEFFLKLR